jgi:hypothetical protein
MVAASLLILGKRRPLEVVDSVSVGARDDAVADVRAWRTLGVRDFPPQFGRSLAATRAFSGRKSAGPPALLRTINKLAATVR